MKKRITILLMYFACCMLHSSFAQTLSPKVISSSVGYFSAGGKSLSWTMGEPFYKTFQNGNLLLTQGFQQPYFPVKILHLKAFIEGFYIGGGQMQALLFNRNFSTDPTACDSVTIELHASSAPYDLVASVKALMHVDGNATANFPSSLMSNSYYLVFRHRNSLETWSKEPILFN